MISCAQNRNAEKVTRTVHVETVCLLNNRKPDTTVKLSVDMDEYYRIKDVKEPK